MDLQDIKGLVSQEPNLDQKERMQSATSGLLLLTSGVSHMKEKTTTSVVKAILGGYLLYRGITGYCPVSEVIKEHFPKLQHQS